MKIFAGLVVAAFADKAGDHHHGNNVPEIDDLARRLRTLNRLGNQCLDNLQPSAKKNIRNKFKSMDKIARKFYNKHEGALNNIPGLDSWDGERHINTDNPCSCLDLVARGYTNFYSRGFKGLSKTPKDSVKVIWGKVQDRLQRKYGCQLGHHDHDDDEADEGYQFFNEGAPSDGTFNPANQGNPEPIGNKPANPEDPRPGGADGYDGPGFNGNGLDGMNQGSGTFDKTILVWPGTGNADVECFGGDSCDKMFDDDRSSDSHGPSRVDMNFDCINFHEVVWFAPKKFKQNSFQNVCLWVDGVKVHCTSAHRYTTAGDRIVSSAKGKMMAGAQNISMRWADGTEADVTEMKVRYEGCKEEEGGYTGFAGDAIDDGTFNPANQGAPAPIGNKPDNVNDPRPGGADGYDGPGFNGNGLDGMNVGSGTFDKGIQVWPGTGNGSKSCTGGSGCGKIFDDDKDTMGAGQSAITMNFDCINFHEVVWYAPQEFEQKNFQNTCLFVDDVKVHCTSKTRYTVPGDRIVHSAKGVMMAGAQKIEMRWADGSAAEATEMKVRYEACSEPEPVKPEPEQPEPY